MSPTKNRGSLALATASALFFLSGGTGLAYQVAWSKRFSHVWGSSTLAMAAVIASFLLGLGLGAHLLGKFADRTRSGLFWYGVSEVAIGILAVIIPFEIQALRVVSAWIYPLLEQHPILHTLVRFLFTLIVIGPACLLMGGTLPLLIRHFTPPEGGASASAGWLYALNTLGAAAGAYAAGFHLLPSWGLFKTNLVVAGLNIAIGAVAMFVAKVASQTRVTGFLEMPPPSVKSVSSHNPGAHELPLLYVTVALTGAASLILEMVWTRQLAVLLGGSTYAFSAMLFLLLIGIGTGSLLYHLLFRESQRNALVPAITIGVIALTAWIGKLLIPQLGVFVGTVKDLRANQGWNAAIAVGVSAVLELLPAIGMGLLFPLFIERTRKRAVDTGKAIGAIYAWNTVGSIAGATGTFLILVPRWGLARTAGIAIALYALALLLSFPIRSSGRQLVTLAALCGVMLVSWNGMVKQLDPLKTDLGFYLYGPNPDPENRFVNAHFREGASSNVFVTMTKQMDRASYALRVNGKVDASSVGDMNMQLGLAYLPMVLLPAARDICVIGFGSGTTSGAALLFPQTRVTCCEIESEVVAASPLFEDVNHSPEKSSRFQIVYDDGRSHLQGTKANYDIVLSEPSNPWIAGVSNLFTKEFYEEARRKLRPGGILAQWLQVYNFSPDDYVLVARTVLAVFPECALIRISSGDTILLASTAPIASSRELIDRGQALIDATPQVAADLTRYFRTTDVRALLLSHIILDTHGVRRLVAASHSGLHNTDLNLKLEFDAPLRLFRGAADDNTLTRILSHGDLRYYETVVELWGCTKNQASVLREIPKLLERSAQPELLRGLADLALKLDPERADLMVDRLALGPPEDAAEFAGSVERVLKLSSKEANRLGVRMFKERKTEKAIEVFRRILAVHPQSNSTWNNLAIAQDAAGRFDEAEQAFQRSLAIDPLHIDTAKSYQSFQQKRKAMSARSAQAQTAPQPDDTARDGAPTDPPGSAQDLQGAEDPAAN